MYNIKDVINRLKTIMNVNSNTDLASVLNISYNTLNTWIKRGKIPQEILIDIALNYSSSLDYILFGKEKDKKDYSNDSLYTIKDKSEKIFEYYGSFLPLNIQNGAKLTLYKESLHSGSFCLLSIDNLFMIVQIEIDIFLKKIDILDGKGNKIKSLNKEEFEKINLGMIINVTMF